MSDPRLFDVLFVAHRLPYPPDKGDRIRTYHTIRELSRTARVHLAALVDEPASEESLAVLKKCCARVAIAPVSSSKMSAGLKALVRGQSISETVFDVPELRRVVAEWATTTPFRGAIASASSVANYLLVPGLEQATRVVDIVDVDSQKWFDYAAASSFPQSLVYKREGNKVRAAEQTISRWANAVTLVSQGEAELFCQATQANNVYAVTNGVDLDYYRPAPGSNSRSLNVAFVGAMDYKPNIDGAIWFARSVWPHVRQLVPGATFQIVGRQPTQAVLDLGSIPGVEVVGQVPDVRPYLNQAALVVAPLLIARGLQNKVLEAMSAGKAIVSSPAAVAGFSHRDELPVQVAHQQSDWVKLVVDLLSDGPRNEYLGKVGRSFAEKYHNWSHCLTPLRQLLGLNPPVPQREGMLV